MAQTGHGQEGRHSFGKRGFSYGPDCKERYEQHGFQEVAKEVLHIVSVAGERMAKLSRNLKNTDKNQMEWGDEDTVTFLTWKDLMDSTVLPHPRTMMPDDLATRSLQRVDQVRDIIQNMARRLDLGTEPNRYRVNVQLLCGLEWFPKDHAKSDLSLKEDVHIDQRPDKYVDPGKQRALVVIPHRPTGMKRDSTSAYVLNGLAGPWTTVISFNHTNLNDYLRKMPGSVSTWKTYRDPRWFFPDDSVTYAYRLHLEGMLLRALLKVPRLTQPYVLDDRACVIATRDPDVNPYYICDQSIPMLYPDHTPNNALAVAMLALVLSLRQRDYSAAVPTGIRNWRTMKEDRDLMTGPGQTIYPVDKRPPRRDLRNRPRPGLPIESFYTDGPRSPPEMYDSRHTTPGRKARLGNTSRDANPLVSLLRSSESDSAWKHILAPMLAGLPTSSNARATHHEDLFGLRTEPKAEQIPRKGEKQATAHVDDGSSETEPEQEQEPFSRQGKQMPTAPVEAGSESETDIEQKPVSRKGKERATAPIDAGSGSDTEIEQKPRSRKGKKGRKRVQYHLTEPGPTSAKSGSNPKFPWSPLDEID